MSKYHNPSPFVKCKFRMKRPGSEEMKIFKGSFYGTVSLKNVCDETSEGGSWITDLDASKTTGNDDVFSPERDESSETDEKVYSPIETMRRSEKHDDEWSLGHIRDDILPSPTKDTLADILSSPEKCSRSDSVENQSNFSTKATIGSKMTEESKDFASMLSSEENVLAKFKNHSKRVKKSNLLEGDSEIRSEKIFDATRIVDPKIGKILLPNSHSFRFVPGDTRVSHQLPIHTSPEKNTLFNKSSRKTSVSEVNGKETFATVSQKVQKAIAENLSSCYSKKSKKNLHSETQIKQFSNILSQDDKEDLYETPKGTAHMFPRRHMFLKGKSKVKAVEKVPSKLSTFIDSSMNKRSKGKLNSSISKSTEYPHNVDDVKEVKSPPHNFPVNAQLPAGTAFILKKNDSQSKKSEEKEFLNRKWHIHKTKASRRLFTEKSILGSHSLMSTGDLIQSTSFGKNKAPSFKISKENKAHSHEEKNKRGQKIKKTLEPNMLKKRQYKSKEKMSKGKRHFLSPVSTKDSLKNFISTTDSDESTEKASKKINEKNYNFDLNKSEDSWMSYAAFKMMKIREVNKKAREAIEEVEEEIVSTPSSTTVTEDSIHMIDTSETERSNASSKISENTTDKFLEEMGLYESEHSSEVKTSKLAEKKRGLKKTKSKVSAKEKTLEVKLQEYKEYLKTVPICDLSLRKWRDKKYKPEI